MPVQINEMIIRANITEPANNTRPDTKTSGSNDVSKEEIIHACAALVMEMINKNKER